MSWSATRPREMAMNRSRSVGSVPLGVERTLNTAEVKSRGWRGSLWPCPHLSASVHTAPLPSPLTPWQPMHMPRYTHSPCFSRRASTGGLSPTGSTLPVAAEKSKNDFAAFASADLVALLGTATTAVTTAAVAVIRASAPNSLVPAGIKHRALVGPVDVGLQRLHRRSVGIDLHAFVRLLDAP